MMVLLPACSYSMSPPAKSNNVRAIMLGAEKAKRNLLTISSIRCVRLKTAEPAGEASGDWVMTVKLREVYSNRKIEASEKNGPFFPQLQPSCTRMNPVATRQLRGNIA